MKILFISRTFPPVTGGIEKQNFEIARALSRLSRLDLVANTRGKWFLPLFLPYATVRALLTAHRYDVVLLGDGVLGMTGWLLKRLTGTPVACILHGLDLTYKNALYQKLWVKSFIPKLDRLIAVGNETIRQGTLRGIPTAKFIFIPNGVTPPVKGEAGTRSELEALTGRKIRGPVLLTLGRLVKRKGVAWFIENVVASLDRDIVYIVAGTGKEDASILAAIGNHHLQDRVIFLGEVSDRDKQVLFSTADIFIQPNIRVPGDMEGFGLVVLEAAASGCVVIASRLEGLTDAIMHGENGFLVTAGNAVEYRDKIESVLENIRAGDNFGQQAREYVEQHSSWSGIAKKYLDALVRTGTAP